MKTVLIALAALAVLALIAVAAVFGKKPQKSKSPISKKDLLTKNEQPMYFRLVEAMPEHIVLAQVAFSALLKTSTSAMRNRFDRKVADFVICDKTFKVIACIELDDSSHKGRERQDGERDRMLIEAGYRVIRYKKVPNVDEVRSAIIGVNPQKGLLPSG